MQKLSLVSSVSYNDYSRLSDLLLETAVNEQEQIPAETLIIMLNFPNSLLLLQETVF